MKKVILSFLASAALFANNVDVSKEVLTAVYAGDSQTLSKYIDKDYIQHNLSVADKLDGALKLGEILKPLNLKYDTKRAFVDGDYVILHSASSELVGFDIFRFKDGKIMEHWDNLESIKPLNPSGNSQIDGYVKVEDFDKTEQNKKFVENFANDVLHGKNLANIKSYFNGDEYIQHNPYIKNGLSSLDEGFKKLDELNLMPIYEKTEMIFGQGNFVLLISSAKISGKPYSIYDLFRIKDGKIIEHWDIVEKIEQNPKNPNSKFGF